MHRAVAAASWIFGAWLCVGCRAPAPPPSANAEPVNRPASGECVASITHTPPRSGWTKTASLVMVKKGDERTAELRDNAGTLLVPAQRIPTGLQGERILEGLTCRGGGILAAVDAEQAKEYEGTLVVQVLVPDAPSETADVARLCKVSEATKYRSSS